MAPRVARLLGFGAPIAGNRDFEGALRRAFRRRRRAGAGGSGDRIIIATARHQGESCKGEDDAASCHNRFPPAAA
jgi:hypothetical protein